MEAARNASLRNLCILVNVNIILLQICTFPGCHAGRFYCQSTGSQTIWIGRQARLEDTFVPEYDIGDNEWQSGESAGHPRCDWRLQLVTDEPRQIFLTNISRSLLTDERQKREVRADEDSSNQTVKFFLANWRIADGNCSQRPATKRKLFDKAPVDILALLPGQVIMVSISQTRLALKSQDALRVVPIDPGYCARDMVSYEGSCYWIVQRNTRLSDKLKDINQSVTHPWQLGATFSSFDDVLSFVGSNKEQEGEFPTKEPINLTQPVHIGLFLTKDQRIKFVSISGGICAFKEVQNSTDFLSKSSVKGGHCGSLRVSESGSPVVEFVPCDQQLPTLISFPDVPRNSCVSCGREIEELVISEISQFSAVTGVPRTDASLMVTHLVIEVGVAAVLFIITVALFITVVVCLRKKDRKAKNRQISFLNSKTEVGSGSLSLGFSPDSWVQTPFRLWSESLQSSGSAEESRCFRDEQSLARGSSLREV